MAESTFTFERIYQVLVGYMVEGSLRVVVQIEPEHHIELDLNETIPNSGSSLNPCSVHLYNVGLENVQYLSQKGLTVVVKAGYKYERGEVVTPNESQVVYQGDLVDVVHTNTGTDVVSTLVCQEGHHNSVQIKIETPETFTAGSLVKDAFKRILNLIPYSSELRYEGMETEVFQKAVTVPVGQLIKGLDFLCRKASKPNEGKVITWLFHRGKIIVIDRRPKKSTASPITHTIPRTRIKGTVEIGFDEKTVTPQISNVGISEVKIRCFLIPEIVIGDSILIEASTRESYYEDTITGDQEFAVVGVKTELAYEGTNWDTTITGRIRE